jgi:hypothetical protein
LVLVAVTLGFAVFPCTTFEGETLRAVDFYSGFGHEALMAVAALMVTGQGSGTDRRNRTRRPRLGAPVAQCTAGSGPACCRS